MLVALCVAAGATAQTAARYEGTVVADEGAWCWFADPRATHYASADKSIDMSWVGYIDVHGNIKATQYDWNRGRKSDVLIRSYFQPDDHNNPTFLVLPDERVLVIYSRHTDEAAFYYRVSRTPGDITSLGDEHRLATANNTTYPSPFILSDDPTHWYLCWRGIGWHPTIARLTLPDADDNVAFDYGPYQIVQSTGARPYAKYQSNGKDKIYMTYTTGHPDNEMPNWLYLNVIDINHGNGAVLRDIRGTQLSVIANGKFSVNKSAAYAEQYPYTVIDRTGGVRNWVWQVALDSDERPVVAFTHIDNSKDNHTYWYGRWTGTQWQRTEVAAGGHAFHQNWSNRERCYSGGMALDPDRVGDLYLSIPTANGAYSRDGVFEIWKYTVADDGTVAASEQVTRGSEKNNVRPYVLPGSQQSPLRLAWMHGDYYNWIVTTGTPKGYPTAIHAQLDWDEVAQDHHTLATAGVGGTMGSFVMSVAMDAANYKGTVFTIGDRLSYTVGATDQRPQITIDGTTHTSSNRLLTSDSWATGSSGTSGDNHPAKLSLWNLGVTYDGSVLTTYRDGHIDQVVPVSGLTLDGVSVEGDQTVNAVRYYSGTVLTPLTVQDVCREMDEAAQEQLAEIALQQLVLPADARTDIVLPTEKLGKAIVWASSDERVVATTGTVSLPEATTAVTLTATCGAAQRRFDVNVHPRDIARNLRFAKDAMDFTGNTPSAFGTNRYEVASAGLLTDLRSYTFLLTASAESLDGQPRFYDFGSGSGNSVFLRAKPLSAGVKYNGGTTTMVSAATQLAAGTTYKLAVTFDAATRKTTVYVDGKEAASGTANQVEPYQLEQLAADARNYIGRTQWWDSSYAADNVDFCGTVDGFRLYDIALTRQEICAAQGIAYEDEELPAALANPGFEDAYGVMQGSGVSSDRAIYVPSGWTVDYASPNSNDLTALKSGDLYFDRFFAPLPAPSAASKQTYWVRQNWGASTITLSQKLRLPEGRYTLGVDVWKSGLGGDAAVSVQQEGGSTFAAPPLENKEAWQRATLSFESDGRAATTILLSAVHTSNGSEKIIGFDNVALTADGADAIGAPAADRAASSGMYDLSGRRIASPQSHGIYIRDGRKHVAQ